MELIQAGRSHQLVVNVAQSKVGIRRVVLTA